VYQNHAGVGASLLLLLFLLLLLLLLLLLYRHLRLLVLLLSPPKILDLQTKISRHLSTNFPSSLVSPTHTTPESLSRLDLPPLCLNSRERGLLLLLLLAAE
jgi:hypothetical protein